VLPHCNQGPKSSPPFPRLALTVWLAAACVLGIGAPARAQVYFDAHNHFTGILPYDAYANLPAFIAHFSNPHAGPTLGDKRALYRYLADVWYPRAGAALGDRPFSPPDGQRFALGARAALLVYRWQAAHDPRDLDGVLERVLTATPWTEFDSAYAFRGGPANDYLLGRFYGGDQRRLDADLCKATVLDLAATNIDVSEQSLPFIGGWHFERGRSQRLDTIECAMHLGSDRSFVDALHRMRKSAPVVRFVLMTHTAQLATLPGGRTYSEWSKTGTCAPTVLPAGLITTPKTIYEALLGRDIDGKPVVPADGRSAFFNNVVGIDTAAPETTCFTPAGMHYYGALIGAVYDASKARRAEGWHGKLLVHTHVGEGAVIDYVPKQPALPWTFADAFARLPPTRTNAEQARANISALLSAVAQFERAHPDVHDYVVFRFAHDTWADAGQARALHAEGIEADVNLESNVATGAYPLSRMPLGLPLLMRYWIDAEARTPATNFALNDLLGTLVTNPANVEQVGGILGNAALRYMLEYHVRCLLGTDADGVEHSDIVKEYEYARSLIAYWNMTDPQFRVLAAGTTERTLFSNVARHEADMSTDAPQPY
jgi:hypothetical protein